MSESKPTPKKQRISWPRWLWVGVLCFVRGAMLVAVVLIAMLMCKRLGMSDTWASAAMAALLPVVARPLYARLLRGMGDAKRWIVGTEALFAVAMMEVASVATAQSWQIKVWLWLLVAALAWAVHGVAADEMCFGQLKGRRRKYVVNGVYVYVVAVMIAGGMMLMMAGNVEVLGIGNVEVTETELGAAWSSAYKLVAAIVVACMALLLLSLPNHPMESDTHKRRLGKEWPKHLVVLVRRPEARQFGAMTILFVLAQGFVVMGVPMFISSPANIGGLALGPQEAAFAFFTVGIMAFAFGLAGGLSMVGKKGMRRLMWPMALMVAIPDAIYVYLAFSMTSDLTVVSLCLMVEHLLCGIGMAALMTYLLNFCQEGDARRRFHVCVSAVAAMLLLGGLLTGALQDYLGYRKFFTLLFAFAIGILMVIFWIKPLESEEEEKD